ncbi:TPR-like protein [Trametes cingulata]|nr:TPR-like protein [Trametes cingulata]
MGRTRPKTRKVKPLITENTVEAAVPPSVPALLEKAQELIVQCEYELAGRFARRVLEREPGNVEAKEMLGVTQLETGELDAAKETFQSLIPPNPGAPAIPPPSAHLYLAQLSDDDPHLALKHYQAAVDILSAQLKGKERAVDPVGPGDDEAELKRNIVRALIGMVEIWMDPSYDLCFDPAAEKTCEDLLNLALQTDPGNTEALQTLASVRMSQQRPDDAKACLEQAWSQWKDLDLDDPRLPPIPSRLALVKLFLELALYTPALLVLQGIMATDDQEVEAWYLEGWCFFLMAEQAQENGGKLDELTWEELARDARDCLETCQMLHVNQEHPDKPLLEHVRELIAKLEALGIQPSPDKEGSDEEGGWEDIEGSDDEDGDVEMS